MNTATLELIVRLPGCPWCDRKPAPCERCHRLYSIGLLAEAIHLMPFRIFGTGQGVVPGPQALDALDAIAFLLIDRGKLRLEMNRAIREEQLGAQRDARDAYYEGQRDGRVNEL